MKKLFMVAIILMVGIGAAMAQKQVQWEAVAGLNFSKINVTGYSSKLGFNAGIRGELELPTLYDGAYVNAAALLSLKGASLDWGELANGKSNAYYLDIPIHLGYKHTVNNDFSLFGEFGPYFAIGLFGDTDTASEYGEESESHSTFDEFKRFDFGLGLRIGAEIKQKYSLSLGYDFGLLNCWNSNYWGDEDEDIDLVNTVKNRNFYISLGYKF